MSKTQPMTQQTEGREIRAENERRAKAATDTKADSKVSPDAEAGSREADQAHPENQPGGSGRDDADFRQHESMRTGENKSSGGSMKKATDK